MGSDEKLPQTLCGGGISSSSEGQAFGIYADNRYCIADLACPITVKGAVINACTYGYVLGKDVIGERDNVGLYNKYSNDSSQFGVDWSCFDLEVGNVHDSAIGIYLAEGENISEPLQGNLKVRGDKKVHGIYTHGALKGKVSGGLTLIENCSRHREGDAYGYVLGNQVVQPRDSVGFYNAVNKDSFGIKVDWKNFNLTVISDLKAARAIYLTGDYELGAPINGEITAVSYDGAQATALHYESRAPITLGINAKIMAAIKGESIENPVKDSYSRYHETAGLGTAIENTVQGIHLRCPYELDEPTIQITGNLIAGEREIYLEQGNYAVSADRIQASTLNLGRSKIVLNKPTSFEGVTTLRMDSVTDMFHPPIVNTSDAELDLSQVKDIYFSYFSTQGIELNCIVKGKVKWGEGMKVHVSYPEKGKMEVLTYPDDFESEKK